MPKMRHEFIASCGERRMAFPHGDVLKTKLNEERSLASRDGNLSYLHFTRIREVATRSALA